MHTVQQDEENKRELPTLMPADEEALADHKKIIKPSTVASETIKSSPNINHRENLETTAQSYDNFAMDVTQVCTHSCNLYMYTFNRY